MACSSKGVAHRENIITALLLIAGALLALALFAAGALWRGKSSAPRQKTSELHGKWILYIVPLLDPVSKPSGPSPQIQSYTLFIMR